MNDFVNFIFIVIPVIVILVSSAILMTVLAIRGILKLKSTLRESYK